MGTRLAQHPSATHQWFERSGDRHESWLDSHCTDSERFALLIGWREASTNDIPTARPMDPPWEYRYVWRELHAAFVEAGLTPRFDSFEELRWYECESIPPCLVRRMSPAHGTPAHTKLLMAGMYLHAEHSIVMRADCLHRFDVVRHHMTHAMRGDAEHDPKWFATHFGNEWVAPPMQAAVTAR